ncbi:MAG TPA: alpha/beta fold hydrolase [Candidatus Saccharimonadales bacterium]|jgi:hypothetical protein|nr:alpha/beta fold hydrolase [Candidatus Saccharimonadales bacterium]
MQKVVFQSGELKLSGTLALPEVVEPVAGVVLFHGMTSSENSYAPLAESLAAQGIAGLAVSMRGHGDSEGGFATCTVAEAINDGLAAYDFLTSHQAIDASRIGLLGSSVGAILALITTEKRNVKSLVLRAPAVYTPEMLQLSMADTMTNEGSQFHEVNDLLKTPAGKAVAVYTGNLLVIASENDTIIPASVTNDYIGIADKAGRKELIVLQGAPHNLSGTAWKDECNRIASDWFASTL